MAHGLVEQRRRAVARVALYGSLLLVAAVTFVARSYLRLPPASIAESRWLDEDWGQLVSVRLLQQLIRIDTTEATGDPYAAMLLLSTPLEAAGLDVHIERVGPHEANLWAELRGRDPRALVLLSHLDVEGVGDTKEWEHPPFAGVLQPPWLHGRGAFDMKSYTAAQLLALLQLAARGVPPDRSVILLATSGEEAGSDLGMRWFVRQHPDVVRRFWAVMTEGGVVEARRIDDPKYWGIDVGEKRFVELLACAPTRQRLVELTRDIAGRQGPWIVDPSVRRFWALYGGTRDLPALRAQLADPDAIARDPLAAEEVPSYLRSMLRNEVLTFGAQPSPGGGWQLRIVLDLLPGADLATVWRELLPSSLTGGVTITLRDPQPPSVVSPIDHPVMRAITDELRMRYPRVVAGPYVHPFTATDMRFLRPLGVAGYGFSPFLILTPDTEHMHRANERVPVTTFAEGVDLYEAVVRRLADNSRQSS